MGMTTLNRPAGHYGLSLILGGGEVSMWDLAGIYASLARVLNHQYDYSGRYNPLDYHPPRYLAGAWTDDEDLPGSGNHGEAGDLREAVNSAGAATLEKPRLSTRGRSEERRVGKEAVRQVRS